MERRPGWVVFGLAVVCTAAQTNFAPGQVPSRKDLLGAFSTLRDQTHAAYQEEELLGRLQ
jgi:hypothetical protein